MAAERGPLSKWMDSRLTLYSACILGAIGVFLLLRRGKRAMAGIGALLGLAAFGLLLVESGRAIAGEAADRPQFFFLTFSALALFASIKMVTTSRPVYAALYFVLVVISSAGLFLLLAAEFMTFALVIVYAGAILITYLFVLMLAQQSPVEGSEHGEAEYDVNPREPAAAVAVGFLLLASLGDLMFQSEHDWPQQQSARAAQEQAWWELEQMPRLLREKLEAEFPDFNWPPDPDDDGRYIRFDAQGAFIKGHIEGGQATQRLDLPDSMLPDNTRRVGWALVKEFPVSLELAGVILTMAMFGAVVLARRQIELDEDEKREAAGMRRLSPDAIDTAEHADGEAER